MRQRSISSIFFKKENFKFNLLIANSNKTQQKPISVPWTVTSRDISSMLSTYTNNAAIWITNIL
uniref:Uncharacterized protein n=1 Tax=Solanum tuberosum TaxID=4113 RepID=M1D734_SOLTU